MVTLKAQKADSIFGSQGATKNYVRSKINAIPAAAPAADTVTGTGSTGYFSIWEDGPNSIIEDAPMYYSSSLIQTTASLRPSKIAIATRGELVIDGTGNIAAPYDPGRLKFGVDDDINQGLIINYGANTLSKSIAGSIQLGVDIPALPWTSIRFRGAVAADYTIFLPDAPETGDTYFFQASAFFTPAEPVSASDYIRIYLDGGPGAVSPATLINGGGSAKKLASTNGTGSGRTGDSNETYMVTYIEYGGIEESRAFSGWQAKRFDTGFPV